MADQLATSTSFLSLQTSEPTPHTATAPTTFLDLPVEIRLAVYSAFQKSSIPKSTKKRDLWIVQLDKASLKTSAEHGPLTDGDGEENRSPQRKNESETYKAVAKSRRSLLLTCKKVHEEWSPFFWSSTTIVLGTSIHTDPATFERQFLARVDRHKRDAIRHLAYNPLKWKQEHGDHPKSTEHDCHHIGVLKLGRVLETWPSLLSNLKDIKIIFELKHTSEDYILDVRRGQTAGGKWFVMDPTGVWKSLRGVLDAQGNEWDMKRSIGFTGYRCVEDGGVYCWIATRWQLVCERMSASQIATS
ncbi:hypothetical protein H2200_011393 [Cladophialophora chaetospira]|uniref:Uncharacterized protein n=1 Tax=Cladophialophora chaetospira TaxID=386627 RepID=A0AA38WZ86_9EURO|nr:hypothetical protein H2200_011393 [Cladophialophora chaetospira]